MRAACYLTPLRRPEWNRMTEMEEIFDPVIDRRTRADALQAGDPMEAEPVLVRAAWSMT